MKLSNKLPQFNNEPTLLVILSAHDARFIVVENGELNEKKALHIPKERYSDREGRFDRRGDGEFMGSGSVYENKKEHHLNHFFNTFSRELKSVLNKEKPMQYILFCPEHICPQAMDVIKKATSTPLALKVAGNYIEHHPIELIKRIADAQQVHEPILNKEARAILDRTEEIS